MNAIKTAISVILSFILMARWLLALLFLAVVAFVFFGSGLANGNGWAYTICGGLVLVLGIGFVIGLTKNK